MGLLMSDVMPLDSLLGTTSWMQENQDDWMYATDVTREQSEQAAANPTE